MARIKWCGIINDPREFQTGTLAQNAVKMRMPETIIKMQLYSLPFAAVMFALCFGAMFVRTFSAGEMVFSPFFVPLGALIGLLLLIVHELLHAVVYPSGAEAAVGIMPKQAAAVVLASYPLSRKRFTLMSLLPAVLGIIPLAVFCFLPADMKRLSGIMFGAAIMGCISVAPDIYNVFQMLRQAPSGSMIQFHGDDMYYICSVEQTIKTETERSRRNK